MERIRTPYQGVWNIIRFNWHFYLSAFILILLISVFSNYLTSNYQILFKVICGLIITVTLISLLISFYVYDLSDLYKLNWLKKLEIPAIDIIVNINAGFDETSELLKNKFPHSKLVVFDFYNPLNHTEVSIRRARKAYPPYPDTQIVATSNLPLQNNTVDIIFIILAAHEIRDKAERIIFFNELRRIVKPAGKIIVVEHLRDLPNFLAYSIGFLHFLSKANWSGSFKSAELHIIKEVKITPFVTAFILEKYDVAS